MKEIKASCTSTARGRCHGFPRPSRRRCVDGHGAAEQHHLSVTQVGGKPLRDRWTSRSVTTPWSSAWRWCASSASNSTATTTAWMSSSAAIVGRRTGQQFAGWVYVSDVADGRPIRSAGKGLRHLCRQRCRGPVATTKHHRRTRHEHPEQRAALLGCGIPRSRGRVHDQPAPGECRRYLLLSHRQELPA